MKTYQTESGKRWRWHVMALLVLLWAQTCPAFYNPSQGRWLSRDPVEETGGLNLSAALANQPVSSVDGDGRTMLLREHFWVFQSPPTTGIYQGYLGLTYFQPFEPLVKPFPALGSSCCWKIYFGGYADLYSWWVAGTWAPDGMSSQEHEMRHVGCAKAMFGAYNASGGALASLCSSKAKAQCYASVILGSMVRAYAASYDTGNMEIDCQVYGRHCSELAAQIAKEAAAYAELSSALGKCAQLE